MEWAFAFLDAPQSQMRFRGTPSMEGGIGARGEGLSHPHSSTMEKEKLQNQLPGVFLSRVWVTWLCRVCLFFTFSS